MDIIGYFTGYHTLLDNEPYCPRCGSRNVIEQGWPEHNHRHFCRNGCGMVQITHT